MLVQAIINRAVRTLFAALVTIGITALLHGCNTVGNEQIIETNTFRFQTHKEIQFDSTAIVIPGEDTIPAFRVSIIEGNGVVFRYRSRRDPPENVDDGGFEEILIFPLSTNKFNFHFENDELNEIPVYYSRSCTFCPGSGSFFKVSNGFLEGEKLSETVWNIRISLIVNLPFNETRRVNKRGIFVFKD